MIKVLIWAEQFWPAIGGIEVLLSDLILDLKHKGIEFEVICNRYSQGSDDVSYFHGIPVHRFSFHKALLEKNILEIVRISAEINKIKQRFCPDVVHYHSTGPSLFFDERCVQSDTGSRLFTIHGYWEPEKYTDLQSGEQSLLYRSLQRADQLTAVSNEVLERTKKFAPSLSSPLKVIYNGRRVPPVERKPLSFSPPRILGLGRIIEDKGFDLIIKAMPKILSEFSDTELVLAGDGEARSGLESLVKEVGVADSVTFAGWVEPEATFELINDSSMIVIPSRWREAFGIVALEASFLARPVVAADIGGLGEIIESGVSGVLFETENVKSLEDSVLGLLREQDLAQKLGQAGYERVSSLFSWGVCVDSYENTYRELAEVDRVKQSND